jgi:acylphosphatase
LGRIEGNVPRAVHVRIRGRVQGVGYRYFVVEAGRAAGVTGFVRNLENGDVEVRAEGPGDALAPFLAALRAGPRMSRVEGFEVHDIEASGAFREFGVRY